MSDSDTVSTAATAQDPEELARANLYGLVSRLFYAPADPNLLAEISRSGQAGEGQVDGSGLVAAWRNLQDACRNAYPAIVRQEYDSLLVGVGKAEVTPYLSAYAEPSAPDRYLVRLRGELAAWGLSRRERVFEVEDHISGVSDVMRCLIEGRYPLEEQQRFFESFVYHGAVAFCVAVQNAASANFYKQVASFAGAFFELEKAAFEMTD
ncbi:MAG: molecular chaperone TorD family protein [Betaproteobacteria bacterium]|nr:molecular chaperone TorD family protein [Betaproteobacteria bacterium]